MPFEQVRHEPAKSVHPARSCGEHGRAGEGPTALAVAVPRLPPDLALGQGRTVADLLAAGMPLAEGAHTAAITADLAARHGVEVPIIAAVAAIIEGRLTVDQAVDDLVRRPLKAENA